MTTRVHLIRRDYPHWGQYSGINQFIKYINPKKFAINTHVVSRGDSNFPIANAWVRSGLRRFGRKTNLSTIPMYELNDLVAESAALRQWWRGCVDILHYLSGDNSLQYLPLVLRSFHGLKSRLPIVATFHQPLPRFASWLNVNIIRRLEHVVVVSPCQVSFFEQHLPSDRISVILHGVDVEHFRPVKHSEERQTFRCLTVGFWLRDYDVLWSVAERLSNYSDIEFHIVTSVVTPPRYLKNVYIHRNIDDDALLLLYQNSDILFLPLIDATANNALLEGISCGLPVVTTDLGALKAYVSQTEALLIPKNHPEEFVHSILALYRNPNLCNEMSAYARRRALDLSWKKIAYEYETLYSSLLT